MGERRAELRLTLGQASGRGRRLGRENLPGLVERRCRCAQLRHHGLARGDFLRQAPFEVTVAFSRGRCLGRAILPRVLERRRGNTQLQRQQLARVRHVRQAGRELCLSLGEGGGGSCRLREPAFLRLFEPGLEAEQAQLQRSENPGCTRHRGVVLRLVVGDTRRCRGQLHGMAALRVVARRFGVRDLLFEVSSPGGFLRAPLLELGQCLLMLRGLAGGGRALADRAPFRLMELVLSMREFLLERQAFLDALGEHRAELGFAAGQELGGSGGVCLAVQACLFERARRCGQLLRQRVARARGVRQARRELLVPLREMVGGGGGLRLAPIFCLLECGLELEEFLFERGPDLRGASHRGAMLGLAFGELRLRRRQRLGVALRRGAARRFRLRQVPLERRAPGAFLRKLFFEFRLPLNSRLGHRRAFGEAGRKLRFAFGEPLRCGNAFGLPDLADFVERGRDVAQFLLQRVARRESRAPG